MILQTSGWAQEEFGQIQLGDKRRTKRLIRLAAERAAQPNASIPQSCGSAAATKAAYRFYENDEVPRAEILRSHRQVTLSRLATEKIVLAVQDTTQLDYSDHPATTGLGILHDAEHRGLLLHTTLAVTPQRLPLGLLDQQVWVRPAADLGKRHRCRSRRVAEKESQKWLTSLEATAAVQKELSQTRLVSVGDREADFYDLFMQAQALHQEVLVRAARDRRVAHPEPHLWAYLENQPVAGSLTVTIPRQGNQPTRTATLTVRFAQVTLRPPHHRTAERLPLVTVAAVFAREETPPTGVEAVSWLLLTTVAVQTLADACERVQWYTCRWLVELYHKVLKSGCQVEERQFADVEPLTRYLALDSIVAWRVLFLTMVGREVPHMSCAAILEAHEWQALYCFTFKTSVPPTEPPSLHQATRWIAQLGGFLGRKGDGEPGVIVVWRGLQRLHDIAAAWLIFHPSPLPEKDVGTV